MFPLIVAALTAAAPAEAKVLTFEQALEKAEKQSLDLQVARARLTQAQTNSSKAWSYYLPQVSVGGSFTRNNTEAILQLPTAYSVIDYGFPTADPTGPDFPQGASPTTLGTFTPLAFGPEIPIQRLEQWGAQAQVNQALIAPALVFAIQNAHTGSELAAQNVEAARRDLLFGVAQAYFGAAALKQVISVQERQLQLTTAREKDAKLRYETGSQPKIALLRAQMDRARAEQDLLRAQNSYQASKIALATLLDEQSDFEVVVPDEPVLPEGIETLEKIAADDRPDLRAAQLNLELAEGLRRGVWAKYAPSIGLSGVYRWSNVTGFTGENTTWAVTVGLNWTLFDGLLREAELKESGARIVEARAAAKAAQNRALDELKRGVLELQSARANRIKAQEQLELARENQKLVKVAYSAGAATYLEASDADTALLGAETAAVGESINASLAALRVLKAAGQFGAQSSAK